MEVGPAVEGRHEVLVRRQVSTKKRRAHSLSVADAPRESCRHLRSRSLLARVSGILHDWCKALSKEDVIRRATELGVDLGVDLRLVQPLLHGIVAAEELPGIYPELPPEVFRAIRLHTTGAVDMTPLDMVVFVRWHRAAQAALRGCREGSLARGNGFPRRPLLGVFVGGIVYVIEGGRYLYPGTIEIYNALALRRGGDNAVAQKN